MLLVTATDMDYQYQIQILPVSSWVSVTGSLSVTDIGYWDQLPALVNNKLPASVTDIIYHWLLVILVLVTIISVTSITGISYQNLLTVSVTGIRYWYILPIYWLPVLDTGVIDIDYGYPLLEYIVILIISIYYPYQIQILVTGISYRYLLHHLLHLLNCHGIIIIIIIIITFIAIISYQYRLLISLLVMYQLPVSVSSSCNQYHLPVTALKMG